MVLGFGRRMVISSLRSSKRNISLASFDCIGLLFHTATTTGTLSHSSPSSPNLTRNVVVLGSQKHGKTSLVEALLRHCKAPIRRDSWLDSKLEREKGLTCTTKVTSLSWKDHILNVIDIPGHDDFLGEVRQGVSMADGAIFVVDVNEGLEGQARFVAEAIKSRLSIILLLNKVDRFEVSTLEERRAEIETQVCDVLIDYDATKDKLDFRVLHASAKDGWVLLDLAHDAKDMSELLEGEPEYEMNIV